MSNINLEQDGRMHVERIPPEIYTDELGNINWNPLLTDYDAAVFHRGKVVTNEEFNKLFLTKTYQGNYTADSLVEFFKTELGQAIQHKFTHTYKLVHSFFKVFNAEEWGTIKDGYYYIDIPASEHGFAPAVDKPTLETINIDVELYLYDTRTDTFYEVQQYTADADNTVHLYTDDNTLSGFAVIRTNERSYALTGTTINIDQIEGIKTVAKTGSYTDLINRPDIPGIQQSIQDTQDQLDGLLTGTGEVALAVDARNVTTSIQNIPLTDIFETASSTVKHATNAEKSLEADEALHSLRADADTQNNNIIAHYATKEEMNNKKMVRLTGSTSISGSNTTSFVDPLNGNADYYILNLSTDYGETKSLGTLILLPNEAVNQYNTQNVKTFEFNPQSTRYTNEIYTCTFSIRSSGGYCSLQYTVSSNRLIIEAQENSPIDIHGEQGRSSISIDLYAVKI